MLFHYLADLVLVLHAVFILFVILGGFLALWSVKAVWFHVPAVLWAAVIEFLGLVCPLTPLENLLRQKAGMQGYDTGFVEYYLVPVLYPGSLTRQLQIVLGLLVLSLNVMIYLIVFNRIKRANSEQK